MELVEWMRNAESKEALIEEINNKIGDDPSMLDQFIEVKSWLHESKPDFVEALSDAIVDVPSKISTAMKQVEDALHEIDKLSEQHGSLKRLVTNYQEKVDNVRQKAEGYTTKINDLEKACEYLKIIQKIDEISNLIESGINEKNEKKQVTNYLMLRDIHKSLKETKCAHLLCLAHETLHYWHNILKDRYGSDYSEVLKTIKWPFVADFVTATPTTEVLNRFQILTELLLQIELDSQHSLTSTLKDFEPISLPMVLLIKPLQKRFVYHFMGSRQTNRVDKPEWYFTQILTWIRDHKDFVEKNVQPAYDKICNKATVAKMELMRGLVQIAIEKLYFELPQLQYDDSLFSHCVDEALGFDKELRNSYGYPASEPSVIEVLTQAQIFVKWINLEKRYAIEKMDKILTSPTAFDTFMSEEVDDNRVTECAESFLALLSTITERYEMLPQPGHRLQFLQLQLDIIEDFRIRLVQKLKEEEEDSDPLDLKFLNILNTVNHVRTVLEEWGGNAFFLYLNFFASKGKGKNEYEGTVFDEPIKLLALIRDDSLTDLVDQVFMDVKAKSMPYRKDRWHAMDSPKDSLHPIITLTAWPMFQVLMERLHQLHDVLAVSLFKESWKVLASKLDQYLYEEIVAICLFNQGGSLQFNYDVTRNIFPLFGQYGPKPEAHFKLLKDSCSILVMPVNAALKLKDSLKNPEDNYQATAILNEAGIYTLKKSDVLSLLSRRTDLG